MFSLPFLKDLLERAAKTFVQAFVAAIVLPVDVFSGSAWKAVAVAGAAAGISAVFSVISSQVGTKDTASLVQ